MRVTTSMLAGQALYDLDRLREQYAKAQAAVNGRVLERPSEDPQRVVEAMDLSGAKLRIERTQRSSEDAREWLAISENHVSAMIDRLQAAQEIAVQANSPGSLDADARESLARSVDALKQSLLQTMNEKHRDQYLFAGWKTDTVPFSTNGSGGVTYGSGNNQLITRDIAPGLSIPINVPGDNLVSAGDFIQTLSNMAADIRANRLDSVSTTRLTELKGAFGNLTTIRSDLGIRQDQVEQYQKFAAESLIHIEDRLGKLTGADLETAVLQMTQAQSAYQAALASFAKALPTSLLDYMLR